MRQGQIGFYFDQTRCSGCLTCILACKQWHSSGHEAKNWRRVETIEHGTYPRLTVSFLSLSCLHCEAPLCMAQCPASAIDKRKEDGIVLVDSERCLGEPACGQCKEACPYRIPEFNENQDFKMEKCSLCYERLEGGKKPICVDACPMRALDAGPIEKLTAKYGAGKEADGFQFSREAGPSIVIKAR